MYGFGENIANRSSKKKLNILAPIGDIEYMNLGFFCFHSMFLLLHHAK
jgi:hypothetical protein